MDNFPLNNIILEVVTSLKWTVGTSDSLDNIYTGVVSRYSY